MRSTVVAVVLSACVPQPASPAAVYVSSEASASAEASAPAPPPAGERRVQVLVDKRAPVPTEVLAVFDFHSDATSEDKGFDELRARAAALGADAVISAEFEHGEGGGPSHLSGLAVRFLSPP